MFNRWLTAGKPKRYLGFPGGIAANGDVSSVEFHNGTDNGQAKAAPLPSGDGRKALKQERHDLWVNPAPVVGNPDPTAAILTNRNANPAPRAHVLESVCHQVGQGLAEKVPVHKPLTLAFQNQRHVLRFSQGTIKLQHCPGLGFKRQPPFLQGQFPPVCPA